MQVGSRSEVGHVRQRNEDGLLVDEAAGVFVVADGMGGHPGGDVASATALQRLREVLVDGGGLGDDPAAAVAAALSEAHEAVREKASHDEGLTGMGTTAVVAVLDGSTAWVGHVGDSRAYVQSGGSLRQVTQDHGAGGYLTQALGLDRGIAPEVAEVSLAEGDRLVLCTDGLTNMVEDRDIERMLTGSAEPQEICDSLVDAALEAGGVDNVTVVVVTL
jgi:protein phosphatase